MADRAKKQATIAALQEALAKSDMVLVTKQSGLTVAEVTDLRRKMRAAGVGYKVAKNRLVQIAIKGTKFEGLAAMLKGPTALAYATDPVAPAKVAVEFAKKNDKLKVIGAVLSGDVLDEKRTKALASLPSLDELRAKLVGMIQTPATRIAGVLQAPAGQLARVMAAKAKQGG